MCPATDSELLLLIQFAQVGSQRAILRRQRQTRGTSVKVGAEKRAQKQQQAYLLQDIPGLGQQGDVAWVKNGYLRNYLQPKRLATKATKEIIE